MKNQLPIMPDDEHRVLKFRPRNTAGLSLQRSEPSARVSQDHASGEPDDLSHYQRSRDEPDDFRHRMLANTAALAFTVALTGIGIWLAMSIADLRKNQDCVLMGRRDCAHISSP